MNRRVAIVLLLLIAAAACASAQVVITSTSPLPLGYTQIVYNYTFTASASNTTLPLQWSVVQGNNPPLPPGITLSANGTLSGTTNLAGNYVFQVQVQSGQFTNQATFMLTIQTAVINITTPSPLPNGFVGQSYSVLLSSQSTPGGDYWLPATMPPGLTLSPAGLISGVPTTAGQYNVTVTVQIGGTGVSTTQTLLLTVYIGQVTFQTATLPEVISGQPYSQTLQAGPPGLSYSLSGLLPSGITFNTITGVFSGISTAIGAYSFQVTGTYPNYLTTTRTYNMYVVTGVLAVPQTNLPPAVQGSPYSATVGATGGLPPYQWSFATSSTNGLVINPMTGTITGTPLANGNFVFPIDLTDATGLTISTGLTLFVANPLSVLTSTLPNATVGTPYSQSLVTMGGTPLFTWTITTGSLPPGLSMSSSGVISGTPTSNGSFTFTVQVTDSGNRTATKTLTISVGVSPLSITTTALPNGQISVPYSQALMATGGVLPYTWTLAPGSTLTPLGLILTSAGVISGTPTGPVGVSPAFTVLVTDSSPTPLTVQKTFTITFSLTLTITTLSLPGGTVGVAYPSTPVVASGGATPYTWSITSGALPPGLQLNSSTGAISGTPTASGTNLFTIMVTDANGQTSSTQLSIAVQAAASALTITSPASLTATAGTAFSQTLTATGGSPPYTWSITNGTLPTGITLSNGVIGGTPTSSGTSTVTLTVTDSKNQTATAQVTITVNAANGPLPAVTIGSISGMPASQPLVSLSLASAYPTTLTGTLSVSFQSAVGGNPTEVKFITSGGSSSSVNFSIAAGLTNAAFPGGPVLATGTVAGTITLTARFSAGGTDVTPNPAPTETITIAQAAPVIQSVTFSNTGGGLTVTVTGYSTTREVQSGTFTFAPAAGSTLSQSAITVQLASPFSTWYSSSASNQYGGQFMLTAPFSVPTNAAQDVIGVSVTLTNSKGASAPASPN